MKSGRWTILHKTKFIFRYFLSKLALISEVQEPKWSFLAFELKYSLTNLLNSFVPGLLPQVLYHGSATVKAQNLTFQVRKGTHDAAIVSPAFERDDFDYLFDLLDRQTSPVGFLDIGANIGAFSVRVAAHSKNVKIWAAEPMPENLNILQSNIALNGLSQITVLPYAIGDQPGEIEMHFSASRPGDSGLHAEGKVRRVHMHRLDDLLASTPMPKVLIVKIDVEGNEIPALKSMAKTLSRADLCWLCLEDIFERETLWSYVESQGFRFVTKRTPYNSWWVLTKV